MLPGPPRLGRVRGRFRNRPSQRKYHSAEISTATRAGSVGRALPSWPAKSAKLATRFESRQSNQSLGRSKKPGAFVDSDCEAYSK